MFYEKLLLVTITPDGGIHLPSTKIRKKGSYCYNVL